MDHSHFNSNFNSNQSNQPSGFRKLDLGSGGNMMMSSTAFGATQHQTTNVFQNTNGTLNEDINQRTLSFGQQNQTNGFNSNGNAHQSQVLNQSMDCQSSMMSTKGNYSPPRNNHQPQIPSLLQKGQNHQQYLSSQNFAAQNTYPSSTSSLASCRGSEYFPTPQRSAHQGPQPGASTTAFTYQMNGQNKQNSHTFQFQKVLFVIKVPFRIRSQGRDEFSQELEVKMVLHAQNSNSSEQHLSLEITDETNPYFLYTLDCSEKDYHIIKNDQSLISDFQQFPEMFKHLIDRCLGDDIYSHQQCPYYCMLIISQSNEASFKIIEQNSYKALAHLTLIVKQGNDESIKKYLSGKLKETRENFEHTSQQLRQLEESFQKLSNTNETLSMELQMAREESRRIADHMKIDEQKKINELREKMLLEQSEMTARYDNEKREILSKFEKQVKELSEEVSIKRDLEIENKEQKQSIEKLTYELDLVKSELNELRSTNKGLDQTKFSQEKSLTEYMLKQQGLERELQDKLKMIENLQNHVETIKREKTLVEETLASQKAKNDKMENKIGDMVAEIKKAQGIIDKQQSKAKQYKQKIKLNTATSKQYEQALQQRQDQIDEQNKAINDMKKDFDRRETEVNQNYQGKLIESQKYVMQLETSNKDLKSENEQLTQKLNESKSTIESNQATIVYLNQRLSEKGGLGNYTSAPKPPTAGTSSFKPTFASIEQLQGGSSAQTNSAYKSGSPYRNFSQTSQHSIQSLNNSNVQPYNPNTGGANITLKNQSNAKSTVQQSSTFNYPIPKAPINNENVTNNIPSQPQFVSKYTQQLYQQQNTLPSNPLPMDSKNSSAFKSNLARNNSASSLNSSDIASSHYSSQSKYELKQFSSQKGQDKNQMATMSFNPYNQTFSQERREEDQEEQEETLKVKMERMSAIENPPKSEIENNESKMSNNEAFLAFLSKNEGSDDDEE